VPFGPGDLFAHVRYIVTGDSVAHSSFFNCYINEKRCPRGVKTNG